MFWGVVLESGKRYTQVVDDAFHVSMASLEPQLDNKSNVATNNAYVAVMLEREKTEFLLCTLQNGKCLQQPLDLNFAEGEGVTLFLNGEGIVHLTGYLTEPEEQEIHDSEVDEDDEEDDLDAYLEATEKAGFKRKALCDKPKETLSKRLKQESSSEDEKDDEEDKTDTDSDEGNNYQELMLKQHLSPKKKAKQISTLGVPVRIKPSPPTPNKATNAASATPKNAPKAEPATPKSAGQKNQTVQTAASNGEKSPAEPLTNSQKKKRKRNRKKRNSLSSSITTPEATPTKTPVTTQVKTPTKTPAKTSEVGQANADKGLKGKKLPGGVVVEDLRVGNGPPAKAGRMVHVHYIGKLQNNKQFDSCVKGQTPFKFRLGKNEVIKGWDIGLEGMKVGGRRKLTIPPQQAYGNKGTDGIPPNSILTFEVQLVAVS